MANDLRIKSIKIRVTLAELEYLKERAEDRPLAPFMRELCLNKKVFKRKVLPKVNPEFMRAFAGACNNINQLAKQVNTYGYGLRQIELREELMLLREEIEGLKKYASQFQ